MELDSGMCPLCGGSKEKGTTTFTVELGEGVIVVRGVPAGVCSQCGEAWIPNDVAKKLEQLVEDARGRHAEIEVRKWQDVA